MAEVRPSFYKEVVRAGYRAPYLSTLARRVALGKVDLEPLGRRPGTPGAPSDDEVAERLLDLPGAGPYAVAHIMLLLGWGRPRVIPRCR